MIPELNQKETEQTGIRSRNIMFTQQIDYLNCSPDEIYQKLLDRLNPEKIAMIVHDHCTDENGNQVKAHVSVMIHLKNAKTISAICKLTGEKPERFQIFKQQRKAQYNADNGFAYLIHATPSSRHKYQYSASDVTANFDYVNFIQKYTARDTNLRGKDNNTSNINSMLDLIACGEITLKECKEKLSGSQYARNIRSFQAANQLFLERKAENFKKRMRETGKTVKTIWIYGEAGAGKTHLATRWAENKGDFYKTTTQQDPFQDYEGQHILFIDELRPSTMPFAQLMTLLYDHSYGSVSVGSRYYNKNLAIELVIITSPYSPKDFAAHVTNESDRPEQLYRRINTLIFMNQTQIINMDPRNFTRLESMPNKYSESAMSKRNDIHKNNDSNLFDEIKDLQI